MYPDLALALALGYVLGGLPFGFWISKLYGIADIRRCGSGNPGATNVWRTAGKSAGAIVLALDSAKGATAVILATALITAEHDAVGSHVYLRILAGAGAILGHIYSPWLRFRGGKGVNTALGVFLTLLPLETLAAALVFVLTVTISRYVSLGSVLAALSLIVILALEYVLKHRAPHEAVLALSAALAIVIIYTHRGNLRRIRDGVERKFNTSDSADPADQEMR
ncbi:MAG: glycerol-3-phosphate 1-O-acyltransferase PlsY [Candidatus Zixiibacteriota bacterium]